MAPAVSQDDPVTVASALEKLRADFDKSTLHPRQREELLQSIRTQFQSGKGVEAAYTEEGIDTLCRHGFSEPPTQTTQLALRCVANCMLLEPKTRQIFVDRGYATAAVKRLKFDADTETEFIVTRVLFYTTYNTTLDFTPLVVEHGLADTMNQNIARHAERYLNAARRTSPEQPHDLNALVDTAKLLYNILHFHPDLTDRFTKSIEPLFAILRQTTVPTPPLDNPVGPAVNALAMLGLDSADVTSADSRAVFPDTDPDCNAARLIHLLDLTISSYADKELDVIATPLLALIRKLHELGPSAVKGSMRRLLLPQNEERDKPLGKSDTLSARLLRLSTNAMTPNLRKSIPEMYFEMSDKDASTLVQNIGYGFAAGFLMSNNIDIPPSATDVRGDGTGKTMINPITGQRLDAEAQDLGPEMTEEEKEREAERLFVLFERLKQTGIIDVQNPVQQAIDEGRFEELD